MGLLLYFMNIDSYEIVYLRADLRSWLHRWYRCWALLPASPWDVKHCAPLAWDVPVSWKHFLPSPPSSDLTCSSVSLRQ